MAVKKKAKGRVSKQARKKPATKTGSSLSFADAAEKVLRETGKALGYKEITTKAVKKGFLQTESQTPDISMHVSLRSEMKRKEQRREPQRFMFLGNGLFTLVDFVTGGTTAKTKTAVERVRDSRAEAGKVLYEKLTATNQGDNFETLVADLLLSLGYQGVEVIGGKDDHGVDILCEKRDGILLTRFAIQCKCKSLNNQIGPKDISTLRDNLSTYQCQRGILITTTKLNDDARTKARETGKDRIHFIEHEELLDLLAEHGIGIRSENVSYHQVDASQYKFLEGS